MVSEQHARQRAARGFTFIEVLVVMAIIAVLAGLTVAGLGLMNRKRPEIETKTRLQKLAAAANSWHQRFRRWPPSDATKIQKVAGGSKSIKSLPNDVNAGIESLVQALYWETSGVDPQLGDKDLGNTDEDEIGEGGVTSLGPKLWEVRDGWGNPFVYFVHTEYAEATQNPPTYVSFPVDAEGMEEDVQPKPWKLESEGASGYAEAQSFQIFSMGPDGIPNTRDDLKAWE